MAITALAPWYGSNRMGSSSVGQELTGLKWVGVMTCGGMSELWDIEAPTILVNDKHKNIINLARVARDEVLGPVLQDRLRMKILHPDEHSRSQEYAKRGPMSDMDIDAAEAYFVAVWMGRSARAGMSSELTGGPCIRWTGNGGSSATRYRSAVEMLTDFRGIARRCDFVCMDLFDYLDRVVDSDGHGLYGDLPFPKDGLKYLHAPSKTSEEEWHRRAAERLSEFKNVRCNAFLRPPTGSRAVSRASLDVEIPERTRSGERREARSVADQWSITSVSAKSVLIHARQDMKDFLKIFDCPCPVLSASTIMFGVDGDIVRYHSSVPGMIHEAYILGYVSEFMGSRPVPGPDEKTAKGIEKSYFMDIELTPSGREFCGLPPVIPVVVVEKKNPAKTKIPQKTASLFDDE